MAFVPYAQRNYTRRQGISCLQKGRIFLPWLKPRGFSPQNIMNTLNATVTYSIDAAHSSASFSVRHMMISHVRGGFSDISGTLILDPANHEASSVQVEIGVASVHTGNADRDNHLRTGDFFDAAQYPKITFTSTKVEKTGDEEGNITGNLTIHGVTKSVTLAADGGTTEVNDLYGNLRLGFSARTKIKRSDYGLTYNSVLETGGVLIGDDVEVTLDVQFVRPAA